MSIYRKPPAALTIAPRTPWWRLLRAWVGGTFSRLEWAQTNRRAEILRRRIEQSTGHIMSLGWVPRGFARVEEKIRHVSTGGPS